MASRCLFPPARGFCLIALYLVAALILGTPSNVSADLTSGLVLYYSFDTNTVPVADDSGNGHTGAVYGATWVADGPVGGAYSLDGTNDYIAMTGYKGALGSNGISVSMWTRCDTYNPEGPVMIRWGDGSQWGGMFGMCFNGTANRSIIGQLGGWTVTGGYAPQADGLWHHAVLVTDGDIVSMYLDGLLAGTVDTSNGMNVRSKNDVVMGQDGGGHGYLDGAIDEVRIYGRALTANEVVELYEAGGGSIAELVIQGSPAQYGNPTPAYGTNLVALLTVVTNRVAGSVSGGAGVRHECTGWSGTGSATNGVGTNAVFAVATNSTLTWNWRTEFYLDTAAGANGTVDLGDGWYTNGASVTITATASNSYLFAGWSGDVPPGMTTNNPVTVSMDQARTITAMFSVDVGAGLTNGLVFYYSFDTNTVPVSDDSGNGHTGGVYGATWSTEGLKGGSYSFDGGSDYIRATGYKGVSGSGPRTVAFWYKTTQTANNVPMFFYGSWTGVAGDGVRIGINNPDAGANLQLDGGQTIAQSISTNDGAWHQAVFTYNCTSACFYVDGTLVGVSNNPSINSGTTYDVYLGRFGGMTLYFAGSIDEVRMYDRAFDADETMALYEHDLGPLARLSINGSPGRYGSPAPQGYGTNRVQVGSSITNSVVSPISGGAGIQHFCTGWTGTGDITNGTGTNVVFTITTNSTLTWNWRTEYYLDTAAGSSGSVDIADGWYTNGASVTVTATASNTYRFAGWSGDVPAGMTTNNPLTIVMDQARSITGLFTPESSGTLSDGLVLYYSFDTSAAPVPDDSGNGHTGAVYGCTWVAEGRLGGAYTLDGINDYITTPGYQGVLGSNGASFSAWTRSDSYNPAGQLIVLWGDATKAGSAFLVGYRGDANHCVFGGVAGAWNLFGSSAPQADGLWHHVALVTDGDMVFLYIDGKLESSVDTSNKVNILTKADVIMGQDGAGHGYLDGAIDEVRIYNRALTSNEVTELCEAIDGSRARLVVAGSPARNGSPAPLGYGTNLVLLGSSVTNSVASPISGGAGIQHFCTGWTGTGDVTNGIGTSVVFTITANSTLTWNWRTEYYLDTAAGANGSVNVADGWYTNGASVTVTATASNTYRFAGWSGDVPAGMTTNNPLTLLMDQARSVAGLFTSATNGSLSDGLVLYYSFDTSSAPIPDDSGNGHTGAVCGATWVADGRLGGAYTLDGTNDYITTPGYQGVLGSNGASFSAWTRSDSYNPAGQLIVLWGDATKAGSAFLVGYRGDANHCVFGGVAGAWNLFGSSAPQGDGLWHHVALVTDGDMVFLYIDGKLESSVDTSNKVNILTKADVVMGQDGAGHGYLNGAIDELRIYNRALTSNEVTDLCEAIDASCARLVVAGSPARNGSPAPLGYGTNVVPLGSSVTNSVASPISGGAGIQHFCTGWSGTGDVTNGIGTNVVFTITTNSTLTWNWRTEYYLDTAAGANGSVNVADGWYTNGASVTLTATASNTYRFAGWSGDVPAGMTTNNPLTLLMDQARSVAGLFTSATNGSLSDGLVLYYSFDTNTLPVLDDSGNGHTGAVYGATWVAGGRLGGAYTLDGTNDFITTPGYQGVLGSNGASFSAWTRSDSYNPAGQLIVLWGDATKAGSAFLVGYRGDANHCVFGGVAGAWNLFGSSAPQADGLWHHLALVADGDMVLLYIDGKLESSVDTANSVNILSKADVIMGQDGAGHGYLNGAIDEVRIYNRALTSNEVAELFIGAASQTVQLSIAGNPARYGSPVPLGYGTNLVSVGSSVTNSVASPVSGGAGVHYSCTGWTGAGNVTNGVGTNVVFTVTTNSTLTWNWRTEYYLDTAAGANGSVNVGDGWYTNGARVTVTATASNTYRFAGWQGDVPSGMTTNNPLTLVMDRARTVAAVFASGAQADIAGGLVLHYRFDTDITPAPDYSGNGHVGTVHLATWVPDGRIGGAYTFSGPSNMIESPGWQPTVGNQSFAASFWVRSTHNYAGTLAGLVTWGNPRPSGLGTWCGINMGGYDTTNTTVYFDNGGAGTISARTTLSDGVWHHVAVVYDDSRSAVEVYVDGLLEASRSISMNIRTGGDLAVGWETFDEAAPTFDGSIDEVRIYNRALALDEVIQLYSLNENPPTAQADFDGDGRGDIGVYHPGGGTWYVNYSGGGTTNRNWGWNATVPVPGDYDGDGKSDIAAYWPQGGVWYLNYSGGGTTNYGWGWSAAVPAPADYDGDGRADIAVYWPQGGTWYIRNSSGGSTNVNWGWSAAVPVPADYDGDGMADIAVYWPQGGRWYVRYSSGGSTNMSWGWSAAAPVQGDYDGDGKADIAVYWPQGGTWYIRNSSGGSTNVNWGWNAAVPVPADYDGDKKSDIAVYWPQGGSWFIRYSAGGSTNVNWGWSAAAPILPQYQINKWMGLVP